MKVLSEAISLEEDILKHLPRDANPEARKRFGSGIEELKKSIKTGKVKAAIRAQGLISEAARGLLVK